MDPYSLRCRMNCCAVVVLIRGGKRQRRLQALPSSSQESVMKGSTMAQRVQVILEDDLDGSEADETVMFGLDGVEYEVDLSTDNAQGLRDALAQWVAVARRTGGRRKRTVNTAVAQPVDSDNAPTTSDIRAWAQDNGYEVSSRGRVSTDVREAYEKANG
ncbi:hypothetical protein FHX39_001429 [Friedmanniella antarctica]|uniref:Lsr2 protein n=2 Tax=Microlunatus antarcticus TaxID=53388 RepID=A0A7W5JUJ5_9ACTN|nr:hypothetical protein [Microlunatus antarcticus]